MPLTNCAAVTALLHRPPLPMPGCYDAPMSSPVLRVGALRIAGFGHTARRLSRWSRLVSGLAVTLASVVLPLALAAQAKHVVLISVDGLMPAAYTQPVDGGRYVPNLLAMKREGCAAPGVRGVFPTVTYPSHTSMVTGQNPAAHGIVSNNRFDPFDRTNGGWYWYADLIKVPALWDIVRANNGKTAAVSWPVTVGAAIDYNIPEYRSIRIQDDVSLLRGLSTPGVFDVVEKATTKLAPDVWNDDWRANAAIALFKQHRPNLLLLHIFDLDSAQHTYGPGTPETFETLTRLDGLIGKMRAEFTALVGKDNIAFVIVSDHGFRPIRQQFHPRVALADLGLVSLSGQGKVTKWSVFTQGAGGAAAFYVSDPADQDAMAKTTARIKELAADPKNGIGRVYTKPDLAELKAFDGAFLAIEGAPGFTIGDGTTGELVTRAGYKGTHGFDPRHPELQASMILYGAGVKPCDSLPNARLIDVAPTVAKLLGYPLPNVEGKPLN